MKKVEEIKAITGYVPDDLDLGTRMLYWHYTDTVL
jgi:hypothetical protein